MKKIFAILSTFALLAACTKAELSEPSSKTTEGTLVFTGSALQTKIAIGDKEGTAYKAIWEEGDVLSIVSAADASVLGTATLSEGAGENLATFVSNAAIADGTSVKLVYGSENLLAEQTQNDSNAKTLTGRDSAISEAITITNGSPMEFTLVHTPAIVKVTVSTSDFAALNLESVMLYSKGAVLSSDGKDYINLTFANPSACSSAKEAWLTVLPTTESADIYAVAKFKGTYNGISNTTVTIPVKYESKTLTGGKVIAISLEDLTLESNTESSWYEPVETRYFGQEGWAYGDANTTYAKLPSTAANAKTELTISVKARGCFNKVEKPLTAKTILGQDTMGRNMTRVNGSGGSVYTIANCAAVPVTAFVADTANYGGLGQWAIYGEDGTTILWTFNLWVGKMIPEEITLTNGTVQDRNLGAQTSIPEYNDWKSNGAYFQWGRFTFNAWGWDRTVIVAAAARNIKESIQHAPKEIMNPLNEEGMANNDWLIGTRRDDLWADQTTGAKSVYDPCPKGYKIITKAIVDELTAAIKAGTATISNDTADGKIAYIKYGNSYWNLSAGYNTNLSKKTIERAGNNTSRNAWYWTSSVKNTQGYCLYYDNNNYAKYMSGETGFQADRPRCCSYSVRCMKDTDNR